MSKMARRQKPLDLASRSVGHMEVSSRIKIPDRCRTQNGLGKRRTGRGWNEGWAAGIGRKGVFRKPVKMTNNDESNGVATTVINTMTE